MELVKWLPIKRKTLISIGKHCSETGVSGFEWWDKIVAAALQRAKRGVKCH